MSDNQEKNCITFKSINKDDCIKKIKFVFNDDKKRKFDIQINIEDNRQELSYFKDIKLNHKNHQISYTIESYSNKFNIKFRKALSTFLKNKNIIIDIFRIFYDNNNIKKDFRICLFPIIRNIRSFSFSNFPVIDNQNRRKYFEELIDVLKDSIEFHLNFKKIHLNISVDDKNNLFVSLFGIPLIDMNINELDYNSSNIRFLINFLYHYNLEKYFLLRIKNKIFFSSLDKILNEGIVTEYFSIK